MRLARAYIHVLRNVRWRSQISDEKNVMYTFVSPQSATVSKLSISKSV